MMKDILSYRLEVSDPRRAAAGPCDQFPPLRQRDHGLGGVEGSPASYPGFGGRKLPRKLPGNLGFVIKCRSSRLIF